MKTATDPRHKTRRKIIKELFAADFDPRQKAAPVVLAIFKNQKVIDKTISQAAPAWPLANLNKVDLAILRLAIFELREATIPPKVIIDEAVELAKEFGSEASAGFVNGVLGTVYEQITKR